MNTISQSEILLQDATNEVGSFLRKYQVSDILKQCNGYKQKGFSVIHMPIFYKCRYIFDGILCPAQHWAQVTSYRHLFQPT